MDVHNQSLLIFEILFGESFEFWEVELTEDNILPIEFGGLVEEYLSDAVDGVYHTIVFGHFVHTLNHL